MLIDVLKLWTLFFSYIVNCGMDRFVYNMRIKGPFPFQCRLMIWWFVLTDNQLLGTMRQQFHPKPGWDLFHRQCTMCIPVYCRCFSPGHNRSWLFLWFTRQDLFCSAQNLQAWWGALDRNRPAGSQTWTLVMLSLIDRMMLELTWVFIPTLSGQTRIVLSECSIMWWTGSYVWNI